MPFRPEALFELLGNKSFAITACGLPTTSPIAIPPALPAPAEYAQTVRRFSRLGRLHSPTRDVSRATVEGPDFSDTTKAETDAAATGGTKRAHRRRHRHGHAGLDRNKKFGETAGGRVRRGAVIPGTKAYRHPNDPEPVEPFSITVGKGGVISLEMVAHAHGRGKRAYHTAVLGKGVGQSAEGIEGGRERGSVRDGGVFGSAVQRSGGTAGEWGRQEEGGGKGMPEGRVSVEPPSAGGWPKIAEEGVLGAGGGGGCVITSTNNVNSRQGGGEGCRSDGWTDSDEYERKKKMTAEDDHRANIAVVVVAEQEGVGGVHGAPVFLGGQLFGFAIQVHTAD